MCKNMFCAWRIYDSNTLSTLLTNAKRDSEFIKRNQVVPCNNNS
jgi:hypothetical protein